MEQQLATMDSPCFVNLPTEMQQHIFKFCEPKTRREIALVCKDWAEKLRYFHKDFQIYLHHCYLRDDLEPFSLLMNSTRQCHFLSLGLDIHTESDALRKQLLAHLGKDVQELDISFFDDDVLEDPNFLLYFPQLKKLIVEEIHSLRHFCWFPETIEHVHLWQVAMEVEIECFEFLRKIKNLKVLTTNTVQINPFGATSSTTTVFTLDENLTNLMESQYIELECNINLIGTPAITSADVFGIDIIATPYSFFSFNTIPNLRSICITWRTGQNSDILCFNFHQAALCPKVLVLSIMGKNQQPCTKCFKSLIDSCPNVIKIRLPNCDITNQQFKYICYKFPKLQHLVTDSTNLNDEIICNDQPEYSLGNLTQLETIYMKNFTAYNILLKWPFMPHLKRVSFGALLDDRVLTYFAERAPNLKYFGIGKGSLLTDAGIKIIAQNWPNLHTLVLYSTMPCDVTPIKQFCRNLQSLGLALDLTPVQTYASFFDEIPTLNEYANQNYTEIYRYQIECGEWGCFL